MTRDIDDLPGDDLQITYFVDGVAFATSDPLLTAGQVLADAGFSTGKFVLVSPKNGIYEDANTRIEIHEGDTFTVERRGDEAPTYIHYEVNGEDQRTAAATLTVEQILRRAGREASVDTKQIDSYFLQDLADGRKYENLNDEVSIKEGDRFLAVYRGSTPVAWTH